MMSLGCRLMVTASGFWPWRSTVAHKRHKNIMRRSSVRFIHSSCLTESWWATVFLMEKQAFAVTQQHSMVFNLKIRGMRRKQICSQCFLLLYFTTISNPFISRPLVSLFRIDFWVSHNEKLSPSPYRLSSLKRKVLIFKVRLTFSDWQFMINYQLSLKKEVTKYWNHYFTKTFRFNRFDSCCWIAEKQFS